MQSGGNNDVKLTPDQLKAVNWDAGECLVSAAAGGGKTTVLVERFIHLILQREADPENLPTLTFTDKAAEQLKRRIRQRLENKNAGRETLRALDAAYISTIHSFCRRLLRENYHLAGIDPSFLVIPEEEAKLMKRRALDEIFEDIFSGASGDEDSHNRVRDLCSAHGGAGFERGIKSQVLKFHDWLMKQMNPEYILNQLDIESRGGHIDAPGFKAYLNILREWIHILAKEYKALEPWAQHEKASGGLAAHSKNIQETLDTLQRIEGIDPFEDTEEFLDLVNSLGHPRMYAKTPAELRDVAKRLKENFYSRFDKLRVAKYADGAGEMDAARGRMGVLVELTRLFIDRYERLKTRRWGLDFDDLQHRLMITLRENPEVGQGYRRRFRHLLIDEFQDNNRLQEAIIREVCAPGGLFMVGDGKQAIYRFRGAEPRVFQENEERLSRKGEGGLVRLDLNFRSLPSICGAVNALMGPLFAGDAAEIDYSGGHALSADRAAAPQGDPDVEFHVLGLPQSAPIEDESEENDTDDRRALEVEADWLAHKLRGLIESGEVRIPSGGGEYRRAGYGDVVVLLRSMSKRASFFSGALKRLGIPHRQAGGGGFLDGQEIRDVRNLLRIIDNPVQDIPFASVLRSPLCGIDADGLYALSVSAPDADSFFEASTSYVENPSENDETHSRLKTLLGNLNHWRGIEPRKTPAELILDIYRRTAYPDYVLGLDGGRVGRANLERLVDVASSAVPVGEGGLRRFLGFLDDIEAGDYELKPGDVPEVEGAVTLMTIHSAKGLEFPVVFIPDMGKKFNDDDLKGDIIFDDDYGPAYKFVDTQLGYRRPTYDYAASRERLRRRSWAEELRVLYVAFTRAREKLIVSGACDFDKLSRIIENESAGMDPYARSPMEWFLPVLERMDGFDTLGFDGHGFSGAASAGVSGSYGGKWLVSFTTADEIAKSYARKPDDDDELRGLISEFKPLEIRAAEAVPEIEPILKQYPYGWAIELRDKLTAGRIEESRWIAAGDDALDASPVSWDAEYSGASEDARIAGRALHAAFELLDFSTIADANWPERQAERIASTVGLPDGWDAGRLARSFAGLASQPMLEMLSGADALWPEQTFSMKLPLGKLKPDAEPPAQAKDWIMLQGRMDLVAVRGKSAWLIDYKSDSVAAEQLDERAKIYVPQLAAYSKALEEIKGLDVRSWIYFIRHGMAIEVTESISEFNLYGQVYKACRANV